jgi:hypothetical protein
MIDLRRFVRAREMGMLLRREGVELRATYVHVSTRWATVSVDRGTLRVDDVVRATYFADGTRLSVTFEVLEVTNASGADTVELTATNSVVLGERRSSNRELATETVTAIHVRSDSTVVRAPAVLLELTASTLAFEADDCFAPADEITLAADGEGAFRVRVRVVRRTRASRGAHYDCRVIAATAEDELRVRALVTARA